jgi:hypothetical protein
VTLRVARLRRLAMPLAVLTSSGTVASCNSLDDYSSLRELDDASSHSTAGRHGATGGTGGTAAMSGGANDGGGAGGALDSGSPRAEGDASADGAPSAGGNRSGGGATNTGGPGGDASVDPGGDARRDAVPPPTPIDIVDGATLRPLPAVSTCGWHRASPSPYPTLIVDFGCPDVLSDFEFVDSGVIVAGVWQYVATGDPHLSELADAKSFPPGDGVYVLSGSKALYMPETLYNGMVSVHVWSSDDDMACVVARYQDPVNYYRLCLWYTDVSGGKLGQLVLLRVTQSQAIELGRYSFTGAGHVFPGHVIGLEFSGPSFRYFLDNTEVGTADDPGGYTYGRVGIEDILLHDAHFDDLTIVDYGIHPG